MRRLGGYFPQLPPIAFLSVPFRYTFGSASRSLPEAMG